MGCSVAYNLALHGASSVSLLEAGAIASGGTGRSCAIVRTHYSILGNMAHAVESLRIFESFDQAVGGGAGFRRTGYLVLGPEEHREPMQAVFKAQNEYGIDTAVLNAGEARRIHPLVDCEDVDIIGYDTLAGYCDPYLATTSYANRAKDLGVSVSTETPVIGVELEGTTKVVRTPSGTIETEVVVVAAGPWTRSIGAMIGVEFPYAVSQHNVITLRAGRPYEATWPIVKDLNTPAKIYLRPTADGQLLAGTGDHGKPIDDPDAATEEVDVAHLDRMGDLVSRVMPDFADAEYTGGWTGLYDIPPDWNPIVGPVPGIDGVYVAVGFSGHGFKLAPTIGEALAQTVLGLEPRVPIDLYSMRRFSEGNALRGAYGAGSIS